MSEENPFAELEAVVPKTKRWFVVVEKIIAMVCLFFGCMIIYFQYFSDDGSIFFDIDTYGLIFAIKSFLKSNGYILALTLCFLYAAFFLFFGRKWGWAGALAVISHLGLYLALSFFISKDDFNSTSSDIIFSLLFLAFLAATVYVLTHKESQQRYGIVKKDFLLPGGIFMILNLLRYLTLGFI